MWRKPWVWKARSKSTIFAWSNMAPSVAALLFAAGLIAGLALFKGGPAWSETPAVWQPVAEEIVAIIDKAESQYQAGDVDAARRAVVEAYFGVFESRKMEAAMRITIGAQHTYMVEKLFGDMRKAIKNGESADAVHDIAENIRQAVRRDAVVLDEAGVPAEVFEVGP